MKEIIKLKSTQFFNNSLNLLKTEKYNTIQQKKEILQEDFLGKYYYLT
jgi:hypothetical protein